MLIINTNLVVSLAGEGPVLRTESSGDAGGALRADNTDTALGGTVARGADATDLTGKLSLLTLDTSVSGDTRARATPLAQPPLILTTAGKRGEPGSAGDAAPLPTRKLLPKLTPISESTRT